jgi:moderate conductance mechanosensitive channel
MVLADHVPIDTREWLLSHGLGIAVILVAAFLVLAAARLAVRRMQRRMEGAESATQELDLQRAATLTQALSYVIRIAVVTVTVLLILGQFDINIGPLLAGAGIAGVAVGFGAQSLVKDFLSGFFILLENQYGVSDSITINVGGEQVSGKVETLSLRTTALRAFDGTLHTVANGNILLVGNTSKGWARAIVDVRVALDEDVDRVREVLEELFGELKEDPNLQGSFFSGPDVLGVERFGDYDVMLRVAAEVRPTRKGDLERKLRQRIKQRFDQRGITIPAVPTPRVGPDGPTGS